MTVVCSVSLSCLSYPFHVRWKKQRLQGKEDTVLSGSEESESEVLPRGGGEKVGEGELEVNENFTVGLLPAP